MTYNGTVQVKEVQIVTEEVIKLVVERPKNIEIVAGQFFMVKTLSDYPLLKRPFSISKVNQDSLEFLIKVVGKETNQLKTLDHHDQISLLGPLGNGIEIKDHYQSALIVAGGIGIAPMIEVLSQLKDTNIMSDAIVGFKDEPYLIESLEALADKVTVCSEDSLDHDHQGYPTDLLLKELENGYFDVIFTCGPKILMKKIQELVADQAVDLQMLLEEKMACGIGACLGCTCQTKNQDGSMTYQKVCKDGPMFYGSEVILDV